MQMPFETWMKQVNAILVKSTGWTADDLPDFEYMPLWESGCTPVEAAEEGIAWAEDY